MDINGDGRKDLIFGEGNNNKLNYYRRKADGTLHFEGDLISLPSEVNKEASAAFADMDRDGDLDLILGSKATWKGGARLFYFENTGNKSSYTFNNPVVIGKEAIVDGAKIAIIDINNDDVLDIVYTYGYDEKCMCILNSGTKTKPKFTTSPTLFKLKNGSEISAYTDPISANTNLKPTFRVSSGDWNGDGAMDLIFGRSVPVVLYGPKDSVFVKKEVQFHKSKIIIKNNKSELIISNLNRSIISSKIKIVDLKGSVIKSIPVCNKSAIAVDIRELSSGIYLIQIYNSQENLVRKVVVP